MARTILFRQVCLLVCFLPVYLFSQVTGGFLFDGTQRTYTVYIPATWTPGSHLPLLLSLHGLTQTGNTMMLFTGFNAIAEEQGFIVAYPDGVMNSWNVGFPAGSTADDVGFLSALIDTLHVAYGTDLARTYATGFSNGGFMSYRLACELGNRIAAIAPVSGTMTDGSLAACQPVRSMPVMHIHGTSDYVVFYNGGLGNQSVESVLTFWKQFDQCPALPVIVNLPDLVPEGSTVQTQTWTPCSDTSEVLHYKVINGGHTWPGSVVPTGSGNFNQDITASLEIWNFLKRFSLDVSTGSHPAVVTEPVISPNPVMDVVRVFLQEPADAASLDVFGSDGKLLKSVRIAGGTTGFALYLADLAPGLYHLRIISGRSVFTRSLLKQ